MASAQGQAVYKKKEGVISVSADHTRMTWTPVAGGAPVTVATAHITNLQQTPDSAAKVMLKVFEKVPGRDGEPTTYLFHFNAATDARAEANAVKDLLSKIIAESRASDPSVPRPVSAAGTPRPEGAGGTQGGGGLSAAMSFASTATAGTKAPQQQQQQQQQQPPTAARWFDDAQLKADIELQQSLMKKDRTLHQTYMEAQQAKAAGQSDAAFNAQFWATRTALLRAHAIETHQRRGAYNVLATIKPKTVDGELKLNISLEQVQMILRQHPLVQRLYDENVPRLAEAQFWSRFFLSRLSRRLRGERVLDTERADPLFDRYDERDDGLPAAAVAAHRLLSAHVPYTLDLGGNAANEGGGPRGNRPDAEMRAPTGRALVGRTLNSLSEKIMAAVAPADADPTTTSAPEADADVRADLALRDLRGDVETHRIRLDVREQSRFLADQADGDGDGDGGAHDAALLAEQVPSEVLFDVQADMDTLEGDGARGIDLHIGLGINEESDGEHDSGEDDGGGDDDDGDDDGNSRNDRNGRGGGGSHKRRRPDHVGSYAARRAAERQVLKAVAQRRADVYGHSGDEATPMGLPAAVAHKAYVTSATTTEFLKQFWSAFLSGDPDRAQELAYHAESLARSLARIDAVADEAERARGAVVDEKKEEIRQLFGRTGRRIKWRPEMIGGGRKAVRVLLGPTIASLETAQNLYRAALAAEGLKPTTET